MISLIEMERGGFGAAVVDSGPGPKKKSDFADEQGRVMETSPLSVISPVESEATPPNTVSGDVLQPTQHLQDILASEPLEVETKQVKSITPRGPKPGNKESKKSTSVFKTIGDN